MENAVTSRINDLIFRDGVDTPETEGQFCLN